MSAANSTLAGVTFMAVAITGTRRAFVPSTSPFARSGDRVALAAYLGGSTKFDQAIAEFAETYADQNERDYATLQTAVKDGKAQATTEI